MSLDRRAYLGTHPILGCVICLHPLTTPPQDRTEPPGANRHLRFCTANRTCRTRRVWRLAARASCWLAGPPRTKPLGTKNATTPRLCTLWGPSRICLRDENNEDWNTALLRVRVDGPGSKPHCTWSVSSYGSLPALQKWHLDRGLAVPRATQRVCF